VSGDARHGALCASTAAGVTWVASAGNAKADFAKTVPASFSEVLTATAMTDSDGAPGAAGGAPACFKADGDDRAALGYSSFAVSAEDAAHTIAAPGTCILSTKLGGGTGTMYGTSAAAPHVAAAAALCHGTAADGPGPCAPLTPAEVVTKLRTDAAAAATHANGFGGDALRPFSGKAFGHLVTVP
jgi:hypothetical protein